MRDIILSLALLSLFPVCFRRPYVGLIVFSWLAYMRVQDLTYSFAKGMRWSFYVAIIMVGGYVIRGGGRFFISNVRTYLMVLLIGFVSVGALTAERGDAYQVSGLIEFVKIIGIALFTTAVVKTREHLRIMLWVIALSMGFYGVKHGLWGVVTLGRGVIQQGPGGMLADNNDFALALTMGVPLLFQLGWSERKELLRRGFFLTVPLTMISVMLTHSRGGFLSLAGATGVLVWRSRNRVAGVAIGVLVVIAAALFSSSAWKERIASIADYEEDSSAQARFGSWAVGVRMAVDNPMLGVGLGCFRRHYLDYEPNPTAAQLSGDAIYVAHNSYIQIWAECGTPALLIYLSLIGGSFVTLWSVRKRAKQLYHTSWIINYATGMEASLVGFMIGSTFLNRAHFDLFYHMVAIIIVFGQIAEREMSSPVKVERSRTGRRQRGTIQPLDEPGFGRAPRSPGFRNTPLLPGSA